MSVWGDTSGDRLREPIPAVLVETADELVLVDTGCNTALLRDPPLRRRFHGDPAAVVELAGDGEPLEAALAEAGVGLSEVTAVALSHLHHDHAGGLRLLPRVPVHCQAAELAFGLGPEAETHGVYRIDFDDPSIDWRLADGDVEIVPGLAALATPGHTPGHQSFAVRLDPSVGGGGYLFAFDAADLTANLEQELAIGEAIGCEPSGTVGQIVRLKAMAARWSLRLVPGHDPEAWPALAAELATRFA
jgi:glyoxylase-like metal-dependent hydrolase (beta-lactamase superfamily II)